MNLYSPSSPLLQSRRLGLGNPSMNIFHIQNCSAKSLLCETNQEKLTQQTLRSRISEKEMCWKTEKYCWTDCMVEIVVLSVAWLVSHNMSGRVNRAAKECFHLDQPTHKSPCLPVIWFNIVNTGWTIVKCARGCIKETCQGHPIWLWSKKRGTENISCLHSLFLEGKLQMVDSVKALRGVTNTNKDCEGNPKLQLCTIFSYRLLTSSLSLFITITIVGEWARGHWGHGWTCVVLVLLM